MLLYFGDTLKSMRFHEKYGKKRRVNMTKCDIKDIKASVIDEVTQSRAKHAVFDLYGTLVDIHTDEEQKNFWKKLAKFLRRHGVHYEYKELKKEYARLCKKYSRLLQEKYPDNKIEINISDVFYELCILKNSRITREFSDAFGYIFRTESREYVRVYEGVYEMLDELHAMGTKVWLLSNAQSIFTMPELESLDLVRYFDGITISSDAGFKKPDAAFADYLFKKYPEAEIKPNECLMVGNEYGSDGKVAENAGMNFLYVVSNLTPADEKNNKDL